MEDFVSNRAVIRMLISIGSPKNVPAFIEKVKRKEAVLSGAGHRLYKASTDAIGGSVVNRESALTAYFDFCRLMIPVRLSSESESTASSL